MPRAIGTLITNLAGTAVQLDLISLGQLRWNGNITGTWDLSGANGDAHGNQEERDIGREERANDEQDFSDAPDAAAEWHVRT